MKHTSRFFLVAALAAGSAFGGALPDTKLADLLAKEPKPCLVEGSD